MWLPLRSLPARPNAALENAWLERIEQTLADPACDRNRLCRETLAALAYPEYADRLDEAVSDESIPLATRLALTALDPRNITLEPEFYSDCDDSRFQPVKPLLWLWYSFDRLPIGGQNVELGVRLRRILARHIFKRCGKNFKCFQHVEFSFGYNLEVGDDVVVHRHVLLDDRGGIVMGNKVSVSDYANIYSHTHSIVEQKDVTNAVTVLEDGVRITYHATVLAGVRVGENAMVGACAVATKDVRPYHVNVGIPAKSVRVKPNAPGGHEILSTTRERRTGDGSNQS
ncbi:MAG TPA: acyltransferase [Gemmatimonadaceae bacterium]|nr:acyltransferase [Gemmatimonadaceae bacterium]